MATTPTPGTGGIDCHAHLYPPAYMEAVAAVADDGGAHGAAARGMGQNPMINNDPLFQGQLDERLAMMDAAGVETHVLSFASPNIWHPDPKARAQLVRVFNDACIEVAEAHPGRFHLFANVPLPHVDEAIAETDRMLEHPATVGISICTHTDRVPVDDERWEPVYRHWNERGVTVFLHPDGFCAPEALDAYGMDWGIGGLFEDTIAAIRLYSSGILDRHPDIRWIVPHLGGTLPYALERLDWRWQRSGPAWRATERPPSESLGTLLFDTVTPGPDALAFARKSLGTDRLVLGSDFPYASRDDLGLGPRLLEEAGFTPDEVQAVLRGNAAKALGI